MNREMSITTKRLRDLIDNCGKSRIEIRNDLGCDLSTIAKHYNGDREVNTDFIVRYAKYFGVSSDYLLGLTDAPTDDKGLQFVCDYTGLNSDAVINIKHIIEIEEEIDALYKQNDSTSEAAPELMWNSKVIFQYSREILNLLLGSKDFPTLIAFLAELIEYDWGSNPEYDDSDNVDKLDRAEKELNRSLKIYYRNRIIQQVFENICEEIYKAKTGNSLSEKCKDGAALILSKYTSMDNDPGFWALLKEESDGNNPET